jgi:hypothetical protein
MVISSHWLFGNQVAAALRTADPALYSHIESACLKSTGSVDFISINDLTGSARGRQLWRQGVIRAPCLIGKKADAPNGASAFE